MYLFAHLFSGILIALGFFSLYHDRRAFPVCIAGALLPDLLDKPLTVLLPSVFGSTRTVGHTLLLGTMLLLAGILLWSSRRSILGVLFAGSVLSHQVLDMLWNLPAVWFFPLNGMFPFTTGSG